MVRAYRIAAVILTVGTYFVLAPFGYGVFMLLALVPMDPKVRAARLQGVMRRAFTFMHDWLRWIRVIEHDCRAVTGEAPAGPCVLVANHPTLYDVTAIMGAFEGVCTVVKPVLYRRWWLRPLLEGAAQIEGGDQLLDSGQVVEAAVARLEAGYRVLIFPEGTRSPPEGTRAFGRTAFEVACPCGAPGAARRSRVAVAGARVSESARPDPHVDRRSGAHIRPFRTRR